MASAESGLVDVPVIPLSWSHYVRLLSAVSSSVPNTMRPWRTTPLPTLEIKSLRGSTSWRCPRRRCSSSVYKRVVARSKSDCSAASPSHPQAVTDFERALRRCDENCDVAAHRNLPVQICPPSPVLRRCSHAVLAGNVPYTPKNRKERIQSEILRPSHLSASSAKELRVIALLSFSGNRGVSYRLPYCFRGRLLPLARHGTRRVSQALWVFLNRRMRQCVARLLTFNPLQRDEED